MLIPGNKNQCHHSFLSSASCCWSFRLLPTSHTTQKKEDEFSDVRGCGSRLEHSKLILYICELAFSLFSLSLSPLSIWYYIFFFFLFFYISSYTRERTNERKRVPTIEKYISTPGWQLGQYRWPRNCLSKKKKGKKTFTPLSFFLQHRYIYRGKKKKPPSALFQLRAHSWNCCCCCTTPWLFIPEPFPETSNDLKPHWYFLLLFFSFFLFFFFSPLRILNVIFFPLSLMYIVRVYVRRWPKENAWRKPPGRTVCGPLFFFLHPNAAAFIITRTTYMYTIYIFTVYSYPFF